MNTKGLLTIIPVQAFITTKPKSRVFSNMMNPYVRFKLDNNHAQTKPHNRSGLHPQWNEVVILKKPSSNLLFIELMDYRTLLSDQVIGTAEYDFSGIVLSQKLSRHSFWVKKDHKVTAKVVIDLFFEMDDQSKSIQKFFIPKIINNNRTQDSISNEKNNVSFDEDLQTIQRQKRQQIKQAVISNFRSRKIIEKDSYNPQIFLRKFQLGGDYIPYDQNNSNIRQFEMQFTSEQIQRLSQDNQNFRNTLFSEVKKLQYLDADESKKEEADFDLLSLLTDPQRQYSLQEMGDILGLSTSQ